jgi:hypothetical protein
MKIAYLDSSCPVAIALDEPGSRDLLVQISRFDQLFSSNLLEAELKSAMAREGTQGRVRDFLTWMRWVFPYRRLTPEIVQILQVGTLRGADLWHLACALFMRPKFDEVEIHFLTLDNKQAELARSFGFRVL